MDSSDVIKMQQFEVMFETESGMAITEVTAPNMRLAVQILKDRFPDDVGADGTITDENGNEYPLNW